MNSNIYNKPLTDKKDETKNHQAFAMEVSRLKFARQDCLNNNKCDEYNRLGGDKRLMEIEPMVDIPRKTDEIMRDSQKETNPNNTFKDEKSPTEVGVAKVTRSSDHSGGKDKKNNTNIITNSQALSEEISTIKYLIEYMNNNKKQNL
jgi:predicted RNA-binding protein